MKRFGIYGERTRDFLTNGGLVLVHDNRAEIEFLFPGARVREVPPSLPAEQCLPLPLHPELAGVVTFPLQRKDFRRA